MNTFNALDDFPETYIYNNHNYEKIPNSDIKEIDIDQVVEQLLKCNKDREKFDLIIEKMEKHFMGENSYEDNLEELEKDNKMFQSEKIKKINQINDKNNNNFDKNNEKMKLLKSRTTNDDNNSNRRNYSNHFNQNLNNQNNQNSYLNSNIPTKPIALHKKYTDVHANTKYYYPSDYNTNFEDNDINFEPSQWTDRANRSFFYNNNTSYLHTNSLNNTSTYNDINLNTTNYMKDNTNSAMMNKQPIRSKNSYRENI